MELIIPVVLGIPLLYIVFSVAIYDAQNDHSNKRWKKALAALFIFFCSITLINNGLSNEGGIASFVLLTSFLLALWKNNRGDAR